MGKRKILVTGGGGYIGSVSAYMLLQKKYEVVVIDNFSKGFKQPVDLLKKKYGSSRFRYYNLDLNSSLNTFFENEKEIDAVLHYAAYCEVDDSMKNPQKYFSNNVCGSQNLLQHLISNGIKNIIFSSTCSVYGESIYVPVDEKHPIEPTNPYGSSKFIVEEIIKWYGKLKLLNFVILRYFNVCGASTDGVMGDSKKPSTLLVQNAVRGALGIEPFKLTCPKVKTNDGTPIRDYIDVVDLNNAHIKALKYLFKNGSNNIINLGTGKGNSVKEIIDEVQKVTGKNIKINKGESRKGEYAKIYANIEKAKRILDWKPKYSLEDSIKSLIKWYDNHPSGWEY